MLAINNYICYMYRIHVENIRTKSFHGCLKEEAIIGGDYRTDVWIMLKKEYSIKTDELDQTVDYGVVAELVVDEMGIRSKLIESVCERIVNRIFSLSKNIDWVEVKVCKINPPIDGDVQNVSVVIKKER